jgi:uncharacterized membrane protein
MWGAWRSWSKSSLPLAAAGAGLMYRGSTRHCPVYSAVGIDNSRHRSGPDAVSMATIQKPVEEVYSFWRDLSNAPKFMSVIDRVEVLDNRRSHWYAREIAGHSFNYEAEIVDDQPNRGLRWKSLEGSPIEMRGAVRFKPAAGNRGTIVIASMVFGSSAGRGVRGRLASPLANYTMHRDLMRLKQLLETGEIATTEGQPAGPSDGNRQDEEETSRRSPLSSRGYVNRQSQEYGANWS